MTDRRRRHRARGEARRTAELPAMAAALQRDGRNPDEGAVALAVPTNRAWL